MATNLLRKYIKELLSENKLSSAEIQHLQAIKRGSRHERRRPQAIVIGRLIDKGFVTGDMKGNQFLPGYGASSSASNLAITPEGEAALRATLGKADSDMDRYQKIIMQAVIDAAGSSVPEHGLPGYNPKTFKLRGKYRKAFDELRGFGSDTDALTIQRDSQGNRMVSPGPEFERIKSELGL